QAGSAASVPRAGRRPRNRRLPFLWRAQRSPIRTAPVRCPTTPVQTRLSAIPEGQMTNAGDALKPTTEQINLVGDPWWEAIKFYLHRDDLDEYIQQRVATFLIAQSLATLFPAVPAVIVVVVAGFLAKELVEALDLDAEDFFDPLFD